MHRLHVKMNLRHILEAYIVRDGAFVGLDLTSAAPSLFLPRMQRQRTTHAQTTTAAAAAILIISSMPSSSSSPPPSPPVAEDWLPGPLFGAVLPAGCSVFSPGSLSVVAGSPAMVVDAPGGRSSLAVVLARLGPGGGLGAGGCVLLRGAGVVDELHAVLLVLVHGRSSTWPAGQALHVLHVPLVEGAHPARNSLAVHVGCGLHV